MKISSLIKSYFLLIIRSFQPKISRNPEKIIRCKSVKIESDDDNDIFTRLDKEKKNGESTIIDNHSNMSNN